MAKEKKQKRLPHGAQKGRRAMTGQKKALAPAAPEAEEPIVAAVPAEAPKVRKKPGPKPKTAEQKAEDAKKRAELKQAEANLKPEVILQYQGAEARVDALVEAAEAAFKAEHKRTPVTGLRLYLKPEENAAYYVINDDSFGKVDL